VYRLLAVLALAAFAGPAAACINDGELPNHEREFRSQYRGSPPPVTSPEPSGRPSNGVLIGAGVSLLVAATALTLFGRRSGN
jgi:hypothetical protein